MLGSVEDFGTSLGTYRGHKAPRPSGDHVPRKPDPRNVYLELHDGYHRVTIGVPAPLLSIIGSARLKQGLGTKSLLSANVLKAPVVKDFRTRIDKAWLALGGKKGSEIQEAAAWARILAHSGRPGDQAYDFYAAELRDREAEIWSKGSRFETDEDEDGEVFEVELPTREAKQRAAQFGAIARGTATPIAAHHGAYM